MVIISPILGQETRNADYLTSRGAALRIDTMADLKEAVEKLAAHPEDIRKMKDAIAAIRKPDASYTIARMAIELADESK